MAARELPDMPAGPLMELHGQRKRFHIPQGLKILLEEASREVLRAQPENIYQFLADFIDDKLVQRDFGKLLGSGKDRRKSWEWRRWSWDGSSLLTRDELLQFLNEFHITIEVAEHLAVIIQSAYRGFIARQEVKAKKEGRQRRKESLWEEWRHEGNLFVSSREVEEILAYYGITLFEANAFATKIQAVFRGHYRRESLKRENPELAEHLNALGITHHEASHHATKIQSLFRGYKARKAVKEMKEQGGPDGVTIRKSFEDELAGEDDDYLAQGIGGEDYPAGPAGSMAQAKTRYRKASRAKLDGEEYADATAGGSKIQGTTDDEEEEETSRRPSFVADDPSRPRPKYDAYFPGGYKDVQPTIVDGVEVPPPFTHEHFGEIDPKAVREKFSTTNFKQRMSQMFKELDGTKEERKKHMEVQEMEKAKLKAAEKADSRRSSAMPGSRKQSTMSDSRKPSVMPDSRKPSVMPQQQTETESRKSSTQQQSKASISVPPPQAVPESRKASLEQTRKPSADRSPVPPVVTEGGKASDPPVPSSTESRKSSKDNKVQPDQERKASEPKPAPAEAPANKAKAKKKDSITITLDRNVSMQADESVREVLRDQLAKQQNQEFKANKTDDYDLTQLDPNTAGEDEIRAATKIQSRVRGMQARAKTVASEQSKSQTSNSAEKKDSVQTASKQSKSQTFNSAEKKNPASQPDDYDLTQLDPNTAGEDEVRAATKIQSRVRGMQTRAKTAASKQSKPQTSNSAEKEHSAIQYRPSLSGSVKGSQTSKSSSPRRIGSKQGSNKPSAEELREIAEQDAATTDNIQTGSESNTSTKQSKSKSQSSISGNKKVSVVSSRVPPSENIPVKGTPASSYNISGRSSQGSIIGPSPSAEERRQEAEAATKIQARVRGMQTRAQFNSKNADNDTSKPESSLGDPTSASTVENGGNLQGSSDTRPVPRIMVNDELVQSAADHVTRARAAAAKQKEKPPTPPVKDDKSKITGPSFPQQIAAMAPNQIKPHPPEIRNLKPSQFPAGGRRSALENFLVPAAPPPNSVFASPIPVPEPVPANDFQDDTNRKIRTLSSQAHINLTNQTTIADHVESILNKALDVVETLDSIITDPSQEDSYADYSTYDDSEYEYEDATSTETLQNPLIERKISALSMENYTSERLTALLNDDDLLDELRRSTSNISFGRGSDENGGDVVPVVPARRNSSGFRGSQPEAEAYRKSNNSQATEPQIGLDPQVNLKNMTAQVDEEISDEWLDNSLGFLEVSEWSARIRDYLDNQLNLITGVLTGEIPPSEAPAQTLGLAIAFVVGIGAGYALLKRLLEKTSPHKSPEDFRQIVAALAPVKHCRA